MVCKTTGIDCLIQVLQALSSCNCNDIEEGSITLNQGHHEVTVKTQLVPDNVYLSVHSVGTPVCGGDIDMVGYTLLPDGFVLYADIKSNVAEIDYIAESN